MIPFSIGRNAVATSVASNVSAIGLWNGSSPTVPVKLTRIEASVLVDATEQYPVLKFITARGTKSVTASLTNENIWCVDKTFNITGIALDSTYTGEPTKATGVLAESILVTGQSLINWCFGSGLWIPSGTGVVVVSGGGAGIKAGGWTFYGEV